MTSFTRKTKVTVMALQLLENNTETGTFPTIPVTPAAGAPPTEQAPLAYRADVVIFLLWMGCFLLVASMIVYETIVGLFFGR